MGPGSIFCNSCNSYFHSGCSKKEYALSNPICPTCNKPLYKVSYYCQKCNKVTKKISVVPQKNGKMPIRKCSKCGNPISLKPVATLGFVENMFFALVCFISFALAAVFYANDIKLFGYPFLIISILIFVPFFFGTFAYSLLRASSNITESLDLIVTPNKAEIFLTKPFLKRCWEYYVIIFTRHLVITIAFIVFALGILIARMW